jgi:hypothetical protein
MLSAIFYYTSPKHQPPAIYPTSVVKYLLVFVILIPIANSLIFATLYYTMFNYGMISVQAQNQFSLSYLDFIFYAASKTFAFDLTGLIIVSSTAEAEVVLLLNGFTNFMYIFVFISSAVGLLFSVRLHSSLDVEPRSMSLKTTEANIEFNIYNKGEIPAEGKIYVSFEDSSNHVEILDYYPKPIFALRGKVLWSQDAIKVWPGPMAESVRVRLKIRLTKPRGFRAKCTINEEGSLPLIRIIKFKFVSSEKKGKFSSVLSMLRKG